MTTLSAVVGAVLLVTTGAQSVRAQTDHARHESGPARDAVPAATGEFQEPFSYGSPPRRELHLAQAEAPGSAASQVNAEQLAAEREFWASVKASEDPADIRAYLEQFPGGMFEALARNWLRRLEKAGQTEAPQATALPTGPAQEVPAAASPTPSAVEAALRLTRAEQASIQSGLTALGFDVGAPDGVFGPRTRAGIRNWQASRGKAATGYLNARASRTLRMLSEARRAVWRIQNFKPHNTSPDPDEGESNGTAFAIAPNLFVTNFHVWDNFLLMDESLSSIYLVQRDNPAALRVRAVHIVSGIYDLVLFQTTTSVNDYLALEKSNFTLNRGEELFLIGYPKGPNQSVGTFAIIEPKMVKGGIIFYEDTLSYGFGSALTKLGGASGGPLLNSKGKVIGVFHRYNVNIAYSVRIQNLQDFIKDESAVEDPLQTNRIFCSEFHTPYPCFSQEKDRVRILAEQMDPLALYQMGVDTSHINELERDWTLAGARLKLSAQLNFPMAQFSQGMVHYDAKVKSRDERKTQNILALSEFQRAADQGFSPAQYMLSFIYFNGIIGVPGDIQLARYWAEQSVARGYDPAEDLIKKIP